MSYKTTRDNEVLEFNLHKKPFESSIFVELFQ